MPDQLWVPLPAGETYQTRPGPWRWFETRPGEFHVEDEHENLVGLLRSGRWSAFWPCPTCLGECCPNDRGESGKYATPAYGMTRATAVLRRENNWRGGDSP